MMPPAYLDPGSGSMLLQLLAGGVAGVAVAGGEDAQAARFQVEGGGVGAAGEGVEDDRDVVLAALEAVGRVDGDVHNAQLGQGRPDRCRLALMRKLRRVHPHDHQRVAVLLLQRPQLVQHMQTVDAAERPKIQQQKASTEVRERQLPPTRVQPPTTL